MLEFFKFLKNFANFSKKRAKKVKKEEKDIDTGRGNSIYSLETLKAGVRVFRGREVVSLDLTKSIELNPIK